MIMSANLVGLIGCILVGVVGTKYSYRQKCITLCFGFFFFFLRKPTMFKSKMFEANGEVFLFYFLRVWSILVIFFTPGIHVAGILPVLVNSNSLLLYNHIIFLVTFKFFIFLSFLVVLLLQESGRVGEGFEELGSVWMSRQIDLVH